MFPEERQVTSPAAQEVLRICSAGEYVPASGAVVSIEREQTASEARTRLYSPEQLEHLRGAAVAGASLSMSRWPATNPARHRGYERLSNSAGRTCSRLPSTTGIDRWCWGRGGAARSGTSPSWWRRAHCPRYDRSASTACSSAWFLRSPELADRVAKTWRHFAVFLVRE
jgi:hypothetical protein